MKTDAEQDQQPWWKKQWVQVCAGVVIAHFLAILVFWATQHEKAEASQVPAEERWIGRPTPIRIPGPSEKLVVKENRPTPAPKATPEVESEKTEATPTPAAPAFPKDGWVLAKTEPANASSRTGRVTKLARSSTAIIVKEFGNFELTFYHQYQWTGEERIRNLVYVCNFSDGTKEASPTFYSGTWKQSGKPDPKNKKKMLIPDDEGTWILQRVDENRFVGSQSSKLWKDFPIPLELRRSTPQPAP